MSRRLRILHAVHDFLPRHQAGSELYVAALARTQSTHHDVFVLAAEYDTSAPHGTLRWREYDGLPVIELINNWRFASLRETYSSTRVNAQLTHVVDAVRPDVLHCHNLLNLSFDLPRIARERGARTVATLHDYTLVCPSGGQRVHTAEAHICHVIDPERCARCFAQSPFYAQMAARGVVSSPLGRFVSVAAGVARRRAPWLLSATDRMPGPAITSNDVRERLARARNLLETVDLFVAPSRALGEEYLRLGVPRERLVVSDYGFEPAASTPRKQAPVLRIGFVGTLVWHKGPHVLLEALHRLSAVSGSPPRYNAHLFGDVSTFPLYSDRLEKMAKELPVTFEGRFDRSRVSEVYANLDVLVVPSLWPENSPLVIHEAFQHGVAVVGSRIGGIPDLVRDEVNGLLYDPFSAGALATALGRLLGDRELLTRFVSAAPVVKAIADDAREWEERYESVLERSPAAQVC
jgi:glycosyltransferase involved in cell wall biosynthesis